jgi:hypothetical protein
MQQQVMVGMQPTRDLGADAACGAGDQGSWKLAHAASLGCCGQAKYCAARVRPVGRHAEAEGRSPSACVTAHRARAMTRIDAPDASLRR